MFTQVTIAVLDKEVVAIPAMVEGNFLLFTAEKHPDLDLTAFVGVAKLSECILTEGAPIPVSQITTSRNSCHKNIRIRSTRSNNDIVSF